MTNIKATTSVVAFLLYNEKENTQMRVFHLILF